MEKRKALLQSLVDFDEPIQSVTFQLHKFDWDSDIPLVTVQPAHVEAVLIRFLHGELTALEIEQWANAIESRDDVSLALSQRKLLQSALYELANPKLTRDLSRDVAEQWLHTLDDSVATHDDGSSLDQSL